MITHNIFLIYATYRARESYVSSETSFIQKLVFNIFVFTISIIQKVSKFYIYTHTHIYIYIYIYIYTYIVCLKQYVGETVKEFKYRWNNYKNTGRKYQEDGTCMQQNLF